MGTVTRGQTGCFATRYHSVGLDPPPPRRWAHVPDPGSRVTSKVSEGQTAPLFLLAQRSWDPAPVWGEVGILAGPALRSQPQTWEKTLQVVWPQPSGQAQTLTLSEAQSLERGPPALPGLVRGPDRGSAGTVTCGVGR